MKCVANRWPIVLAVALTLLGPLAVRADEVGFDDLALGSAGYWNGHQRWNLDNNAKDGLFTSGNLTFDNHYDEDWGMPFWYDWAYSNQTDTSQTGNDGLDGQYCAYADPAGGADGTPNYGVACINFWSGNLPTIYLPPGHTVESLKVTNNVYARYVILNGNPYAKKFGGPSGDDPDWLLLTVFAKDGAEPVGSVDFYLADYRFAENSADYVVEDWTEVDLSELSDYDRLEFTLSSSDNDPIYGMNTPAYFALDSIELVPEPAAIVLLTSALLCGLVRRRGRNTGARQE
jgi:hypothetical protein